MASLRTALQSLIGTVTRRISVNTAAAPVAVTAAEQIAFEQVEQVLGDGTYAIGGAVVSATGVDPSIRAGQFVALLRVGGVPKVIIAHSARRANFGGLRPEPTGPVEMLFLAFRDDVKQWDIYFRNREQIIPLNLWKNNWEDLGVGGVGVDTDTLTGTNDRPTSVSWGERDDTFFFVRTKQTLESGRVTVYENTIYIFQMTRQGKSTPFGTERPVCRLLRTDKINRLLPEITSPDAVASAPGLIFTRTATVTGSGTAKGLEIVLDGPAEQTLTTPTDKVQHNWVVNQPTVALSDDRRVTGFAFYPRDVDPRRFFLDAKLNLYEFGVCVQAPHKTASGTSERCDLTDPGDVTFDPVSGLMQLHTHTIQGTVADLDPNFVLLDGGTGVGGAVFVGVGRSEDGTEFATIFRSVPREFTRNYGTKMDVGVGPIFNAPKPMKITRFGIVRPIHLPFPDPPVCPEGYRPGPTIYNDEPIACYLEHGGERDYRPWRLTVLPQHLQPEPSWPSDPWLDIDYLFKRDDADGVFFYQTNYISSFVGAIGPLNPHPDTVEVDVDFNSGESGFGITSMSESASDNPFPFTTVPFDLVGKALRVVDSTTRYVRAFNRWVGNVVAQKTSEGDDGFGTGVGWADFFGVLPKSYYWQVTAVVKRELGFGTSLKMTAFEDNNILLDSIHYPIGIDDPSDVVQLFWDAVPNAIEYHVYRNIGFDGHFDNVVVAYVAPQIDTQTGQQKQPQTFLDRGQQRRSPFGTDFTTIVNPSDGDRFCDGMKIKTSGTSVGFAGLRTFGVLSIDLLRLAPTRERLLTFVVLGAVSPSGKTASTGFVCDAAQNQIALLWAWDQPTLGGIVSAQPHDVSSFFIWISTTPNSNVSAIKITDLKAGDQRDSITTTVLKEGTNDDLIAWLYGSETVLGNNALWWWFFDDYFVYDAVKDKFVLIKKGGKLLADFTNPFVKFDEQLSKLWGLRPFPTYPPDKTPPLSAPREFAPNGLEFLVTNAAQVRHSIHILRHQQSFAEAGVPMPAQSPKPS